MTHLNDFSKIPPAAYSIRNHNGYGAETCISTGDTVEVFIRINRCDVIEEIEFIVTGGSLSKDVCAETRRLAIGRSILEFYDIDENDVRTGAAQPTDSEFVSYDTGIRAVSIAIKNYFDRKSKASLEK